MSSGSTTNYALPYPFSTDPVNVSGDIEQLAKRIDNILQEEIEDVTAAVITGGTQVGMTAIYNDETGKVDFVIVNTGTTLFENISLSGDIAINGGGLTSTSQQINAFLSSSAISFGDVTGDFTIRNANTIASGNLQVNGGTFSTNQSTFNLLNSNVSSLNFVGSASTISMGSASGTMNIKNAQVILDGDLSISGGNISSSATTFNFLNNTVTTLNVGANAISTNIGASAGIVSFRSPEIVLNSTESGSPSSNAAMVVKRGTSPDVEIRWNESTDAWEFTVNGTSYEQLGGGGIETSFFLGGL
jgi:hypothetical protein